MQKRVIGIILGCGCRLSRRKLFKELKILPLSSQHIFSSVQFVVNNRDYFISNSVYYNNNTGRRNDLHWPQVTLAMYQKGVYYSGTKIFNGLPKTIKDISNKPNNFKIALKHFLYTHSLYSLDEFFLSNSNISLLLLFYYSVFLRCTITLNFSVLIHYPFFF